MNPDAILPASLRTASALGLALFITAMLVVEPSHSQSEPGSRPAPVLHRLSDPADAAKADYVKAAATLPNGDIVMTLVQSDSIRIDDTGAILPGSGLDAGVIVYDHRTGLARERFSFGGAAQRVVPHGIALMPDGDFVVIGYAGTAAASASVDLGAGPIAFTSTEVPFVAKFSREGKHRWGHVLQGRDGIRPQGCAGSNCDRAWDLAVDPVSGRVVVIGGFSGTLSLPGGELRSRGDTDMFVLVLDAAGRQQAAWTVGGPGTEGGRKGAPVSPGGLGEMAVALGPAGLYLQGTFGPDAEFGGTGPSFRRSPANGVRDVFIARYGFDGRLHAEAGLWTADAPADAAAGFAAPGALRTDASGRLYLSIRQRLAGQAYAGCAPLGRGGDVQLALALDDSLRCVWTQALGFSSGGVHRTVPDGRGNLYLAGWFGGRHAFPNQTLAARSTRSDIFLARLDAATGAPAWAAGAISVNAAPVFNIPAGLAIDGEGHPWMGGQFFTALEFAQPGQASSVLQPVFSGTPAGNSGDAFVARFDRDSGRLR